MKNINILITTIILFLFVLTVEGQTIVNLASQCNCEVLSGTVAPTPGSPAANAGNLYVNTTTGDIYTFDGTAWAVVSEDLPDHDWYVAGGTTPPTSINNSIFTQGSVGIGIATPQKRLHLGGAGGQLQLDGRIIHFGPYQQLFSDTSAAVYWRSNSTNTSQFILRYSDNTNAGRLYGSGAGAQFGLLNSANQWVYRTELGANQTWRISNAEIFRITAAGRMGIGVANPLQMLHVAGDIRSDSRRVWFGNRANLFVNASHDMTFRSSSPSVSKLRFYDDDIVFYGSVVGTTDGLNFGLNDKDNHWTFRSVHDQYLTMSIDNSEKVRILANGNMGVGTGVPTSLLDVNGDARIRTLTAGGPLDEVVVANGAGILRKIPRNSLGLGPTAGNDINISGTNTVDVEPVLDFVHTVNSPLQNLRMSAGGNTFLSAFFDGHVGIGNLPNSLTPAAGLHVAHNDGVIAEGTFGSGTSLSAGAGTRMVWSSKHAALRAGQVSGAKWNDANIGNYSTAFGFNTSASGGFSHASGNNASAGGDYGFAHGVRSDAAGPHSVAFGIDAEASGVNSLAIGSGALASNNNTIALGLGTVSTGNSTVSIGFLSQAVGTGSKTIGSQTLSSGFNAVAIGEHIFARSRGEVSIGRYGTDYTPASVTMWNTNDRIFNVGNGLDSMNRADALTIFKSGESLFNGNAVIVTNSGNEALFLDNYGTGVGQTIQMKNATSVAAGQYINQTGRGIGQLITMTNATSNSVAVRLQQNGLATAQDIVIGNTASTANGLYLRQDGLGNGQQIVMNNTASGARGLDINYRGIGAGLYITSNNAASHAAIFNSGHIVANEIGGNYDFRIESDTRTHAFWMDANENIANFGSPLSAASSNGTMVGGVTVDYVADFDRGTAEGTAIGIGSVEFLLDGVNETTINNSFSPATHITRDLGFSTTLRGWDDVYADAFVNTSDRREKEDIQELTYGLSEIMSMRPVSYKLTKDPFNESKLGLIAQEVLPLVSESVKTHDYKILDEQKGEFELVELDRMGMMYQQLIPVLIKAVQEQQDQISTLSGTNENLKEENQALKSEIDSINDKLEKIMLMMERKN